MSQIEAFHCCVMNIFLQLCEIGTRTTMRCVLKKGWSSMTFLKYNFWFLPPIPFLLFPLHLFPACHLHPTSHFISLSRRCSSSPAPPTLFLWHPSTLPTSFFHFTLLSSPLFQHNFLHHPSRSSTTFATLSASSHTHPCLSSKTTPYHSLSLASTPTFATTAYISGQHSSLYHSAFSVTCRAGRRTGFFYWNIFLIMSFISCLAFATFSVQPKYVHNRLQLR